MGISGFRQETPTDREFSVRNWNNPTAGICNPSIHKPKPMLAGAFIFGTAPPNPY
jgi:hypothetical protein